MSKLEIAPGVATGDGVQRILAHAKANLGSYAEAIELVQAFLGQASSSPDSARALSMLEEYRRALQ